MTAPVSVERITYGRRESAATIMTGDHLAIMRNSDGSLCLKADRYDAKGQAVESYVLRIDPEHTARIKAELRA